MPNHGWNLGEIWNRLRVSHRGGDFPPLVDLVQPVTIMGDFSDVSPLIFPRSSTIGGQITGTGAGARASATLLAAPGGSVVAIHVSSTSSGTVSWRVVAAPVIVLASSFAPTPSSTTQGGSESTVTVGLSAGMAGATDAYHTRTAANANVFFPAIYVPPGSTLEVSNNANTGQLAMNFIVQDQPEIE